MKKIITILLIAMLIAALFGCTNPDTNPPGTDQNGQIKVTNQKEVSDTLSDVSTDISGINQSLNEIDDTLTK